ncbi:hypothetical protein [uncultured Adlercreutzia sp.]|uniref:coiled-coil domain-containing protein n=1 Tax=uncultured Adlercreutzia sp. TaxID=875803 RepID=UPI002674E229|nr:hypothetical protein [uncultured Adlercreutzia sp.]
MAILLALSVAGLAPVSALADPADDAQAAVDDAQATLDAAESRMAEINSEYEQLTAEVERLQQQIDETAAAAMEAQQAMLEGRAALEQVAVGEYRDGSSMGLLGLVLDSKNFDDLLRNMEYVNQIMAYQADEVAAQKERKQAFDAVSEELNAQKNEQEQALAAQEEKRAQAEAVVQGATERLSDAKADQAARLAELAAQAEALRKQKEEAEAAAANEVEESPDANTGGREPVVPDDEPVAPDPGDSSGGSDSGSDSSDSGSSSEEGWRTGTASAYGGSTDPTTPNPGTTSTGAICDDNSMGVAVPKSMPNYRSYFGRTVEIRYGGMTVYATVNDCGSMGGGSRVLDLQPGVWKAFGFSSCRDWGLRTVQYRFL